MPPQTQITPAPAVELAADLRPLLEQIGSPEEVYTHPRTPFVYNFLGSVNLFNGRVDGGQIQVGGATLGTGEHPNGNARIFVRPHALDLSHQPVPGGNLKARIEYINAAGPLVRVALLNADKKEIHVELSQDRYRELNLKKGEEVYVQPREMKVFMEDFAI